MVDALLTIAGSAESDRERYSSAMSSSSQRELTVENLVRSVFPAGSPLE